MHIGARLSLLSCSLLSEVCLAQVPVSGYCKWRNSIFPTSCCMVVDYSTHPSIFSYLSRSRSQWEQAKQDSPDIFLTSYDHQFPMGDAKIFPSQMPWGFVLVGHTVSGKLLKEGIQEAPLTDAWTTSVDSFVKEQQFYSKFLWMSLSVCQAILLKKLILAACIRNLILFVTTQSSWP